MHKRAEYARKALGIKGKMFAKKRHAEKIQMKKTIAMHEESDKKHRVEDGQPKARARAAWMCRGSLRNGGRRAGSPAQARVRPLTPIGALSCRMPCPRTCWTVSRRTAPRC